MMMMSVSLPKNSTMLASLACVDSNSHIADWLTILGNTAPIGTYTQIDKQAWDGKKLRTPSSLLTDLHPLSWLSRSFSFFEWKKPAYFI